MSTSAKSHLTLVMSTRSSRRQSRAEYPSAVRTLVSAFLRVPDRSTRHRLTRCDDDFDEREEEAAIADRCDKARAEVQALRASGGTSAMAKRAADEAIRSATERAMDIMRKGAEQAARLNADAARLRELELARALEEEVEEQTAKCRRLAAGSTRLATDKAGRR